MATEAIKNHENADRPSRFNQKLGNWTLNKMTKPVAYHGWATKKDFEM